MKSVLKYELKRQESNIIELPIYTELLSVETQLDTVVVYGIVEKEQTKTIPIDFRMFGTGHDIKIDLDKYTYLGTAKIYNGGLMFHVFYKEILE